MRKTEEARSVSSATREGERRRDSSSPGDVDGCVTPAEEHQSPVLAQLGLPPLVLLADPVKICGQSSQVKVRKRVMSAYSSKANDHVNDSLPESDSSIVWSGLWRVIVFFFEFESGEVVVEKRAP